MTTDEAAISRLIDAIKAAEPHIAALQLQINRGDRTAYALLNALLNTQNALFNVVDEMLDDASQHLPSAVVSRSDP